MRTASDDASHAERVVLWLFLAVFATLLVRTAWVGDDAYITFRVADNAVNGYGLRWNTDERVQAFTHPLWMLLMTGAFFLTRDVYYTSLAISIALSFGVAMVLALRVAASSLHAVLALAVFCLSKALLDYSTSGLENPLTHLLLVLFAWRYFRASDDRRRLRELALLAGLAALNRLDSLALLGLPLAAAAWRHRWRPAALALLRGFAPLLAWTAFSFFYYGFPLPNTVYAKLSTGVPPAELAQQGLHYLFNSLSLDPITLVVILAGMIAPLVLRQPGAGPLAAGIALHLAYVVRVGGDFMSGRFLAAPLLIAVVLLSRSPASWTPRPFGLALAALAAVGLLGPYPPLTTTASFYASRGERFGLLDDRGITDERAIYYRGTGLMTASRAEPMPAHYMARAGKKARAESEGVVTRGAVGMFGFFAGPRIHIIDPNGLGDAFLARLPARPGWRIGHFDRRLPPGYEASVRKGGLRLVDSQLAAYYRKLRLVTQGDLFDGDRLRAIWDLNFGRDRGLIDDYFRIHSTRQRVTLDRVMTALPPDADWTAGIVFSDHGLDVDLGGLRLAAGIELSLDGNDSYRVVCLRERYPLWETTVPARPSPEGSFTAHRVTLPALAAARGCDTIRILPESGDQQYALGQLRLQEGPAPSPPPETVGSPDPTAEDPDAAETPKPKKEEPR